MPKQARKPRQKPPQPKAEKVTEPAAPESQPRVEPVSFYQKMFDQVMAAHPQLEPYGEVLAAAVTHIVRSTYKEARRYTSAQIMEHLTDFWKLKAKRRVGKRLMKALVDDPGQLYQIIAATAEATAVSSIMGLMELDNVGTSDVIGSVIGNA